jgi:molybdate transport repressor ModE-like protein
VTAWDAVELRQFRTLAAVVRTGSFSRAADSLGYTQSAVSQQIARLESLVGQRLVERPSRGGSARVTPAGEVLLARVATIDGELARARADLEGLTSGTSGVLRVGTFASVGARLLPAALRVLREDRPGLVVRLLEAGDDAGLLGLLDAGELDVTFVVRPLPREAWRTVDLLEDPYVVAVRADHPLAAASSLDPALLDDVPLVTYGDMRPVHAVENRLGRPWLAENVVMRSHDNATIVALAQQGLGAAVVSWLSVQPLPDGMRLLPITGVPPRVVGIAWHSTASTASDAFVAAVRQVAVEEQAQVAHLLGRV